MMHPGIGGVPIQEWPHLELTLRDWFAEVCSRCPSAVLSPEYRDHLIGTGRYLGVLFPYFQVSDDEVGSSFGLGLARLSVLLRALTVLDDAVWDEHDIGIPQSVMIQLRNCITREVTAILLELGSSRATAEAMLNRREMDIAAAYAALQAGVRPNFRLVQQKCAYLYIFFDVLANRVGRRAVVARRRLTEHSLFLLQIIDDFEDRFEDLKSPINSNLFTWAYNWSPAVRSKCKDADWLSNYIRCLAGATASVMRRRAQNGTLLHDWALAVLNYLKVDPEEDFHSAGIRLRHYRAPGNEDWYHEELGQVKLEPLGAGTELSVIKLHRSATTAAVERSMSRNCNGK